MHVKETRLSCDAVHFLCCTVKPQKQGPIFSFFFFVLSFRVFGRCFNLTNNFFFIGLQLRRWLCRSAAACLCELSSFLEKQIRLAASARCNQNWTEIRLWFAAPTLFQPNIDFRSALVEYRVRTTPPTMVYIANKRKGEKNYIIFRRFRTSFFATERSE